MPSIDGTTVSTPSATGETTATATATTPDSTFRKRRSNGSSTKNASTTHHQPLNRTEVINHAAVVIEKIATENTELKMKFMQLMMAKNGNAPVTTGGDGEKGGEKGGEGGTAGYPYGQV